MNKALLVIAKRPQPGKTKTRLSPPLSPEQAAGLYEAFLRDTLELARDVVGISRFILYAPPHESAYFQHLAPDFKLLAQNGDDLGARLDNALTHCLRNGFEQVIVMNSDSPNLPVDYLAQAFASLNQTEAVFGPTEDGGYYLVGLTRPQPRLLREVKMSTPTVLRDTLALAREEDVSVSLLPEWYDIDTVDDIARLQLDLQTQPDTVAWHTRTCLSELSQHVNIIDKLHL